MSDNKETTNVTEVDMDLNDLFPGADQVMTPQDASKETPNFFSRKTEDLSFLDKPITKEDIKPVDKADDKPASDDKSKAADTKKPVVTPEEIDDVLNIPGDDESDTKKAGRPKTEKDGLIELANKLIEQKLLVPFVDEKGDEIPIDTLSLKDFEELFAENANYISNKSKTDFQSEWFESLPYELQQAAKYVQDGGQDLKGLFRSLAQVEEIKELDPSNENDQRNIIRNYLQATRFGSADEIEEEIDGWADRGELENKALKFKPKLDAMQEQIIEYRLQQQEQLRAQQQEQANNYIESIYNVIAPGELNGIKIDKKVQNLLYSGLIETRYPSINGRQTNLLGHLLEKHQYVEPNHTLIAEALWLLADPDGYKSKVKETGKKEQTEKTVRMLKTEEGKKISSSSTEDEESPNSRKSSSAKAVKGIPKGNFFKRF